MKKNIANHSNHGRVRFLLSAALSAILSVALVSCTNDDEGIDNQVTNENVVEDDASALSLVNGVYSHWQPLSSSFSFIIELNSNKLISFEGEESEAGPVNSRFEQVANTWYQVKIFNHLFLGIVQANEAITTINNSLAAGKVSQAGYNAAVGKAKFLRALAYLKLTQLWGEVPVFTEEGGSTTERQDFDVVFGQIIKDLTDAESLLLDYSGDPRVPSKQAAQALLARTYLVWGDNPLTSAQVAAIANTQTDPEFSKTDSRLEKAIEYADRVINSGKLALASDFSKLYGRDYESNKLGQNEHLFTIAHDGDKKDAQGNKCFFPEEKVRSHHHHAHIIKSDRCHRISGTGHHRFVLPVSHRIRSRYTGSEVKCLRQSLPLFILFTEVERCSVFESISLTIRCAIVSSQNLRPLDSDLGIVPGHSALIPGTIEICHLVTEFCFIAQNQKSVSKPFRDIELFFIFFGKDDPEPFSEGFAVLAEIDRNIKHLAADHTDKLALGILFLEMKAAQHTLYRHALIILDKHHVHTGFMHIILIVSFHKISPAVPVNGRFNHIKSLYIRFCHFDLSHYNLISSQYHL